MLKALAYIKSYFRLEARGSSLSREVIGGVTTFVTMAYIIFVNPTILGDAGMSKGAVMTATVLASAVASIIMGLFANLPVAKKATGAKRRIECVGKTISLTGTSLQGQPWDLAGQRGKVVIIHYWATWCEPCKQDLAVLKVMQAEYGKDNLALVGVNVDNQRSDAEAFLAENPLSWPQLHEPGGLDSRLSNELGVLTLPTMLMVDKEGKVISRNLHSGEIDRELRTLLR